MVGNIRQISLMSRTGLHKRTRLCVRLWSVETFLSMEVCWLGMVSFKDCLPMRAAADISTGDMATLMDTAVILSISAAAPPPLHRSRKISEDIRTWQLRNSCPPQRIDSRPKLQFYIRRNRLARRIHTINDLTTFQKPGVGA